MPPPALPVGIARENHDPVNLAGGLHRQDDLCTTTRGVPKESHLLVVKQLRGTRGEKT